MVDAGVPDNRERETWKEEEARQTAGRVGWETTGARALSPTCIYWGGVAWGGSSWSVSGGEVGDLVPRCGSWGDGSPQDTSER